MEDERVGLRRTGRWRSVVVGLGSLRLAVPLLIVLMLVLVVATLVETRSGAEVAGWYVYRSRWFAAMLALLAVNIFCAALSRFPWKRSQTGFVITHAGLLTVLAGAMVTSRHGVDGDVTLIRGEPTATMRVARQGVITAAWADRRSGAPAHFSFAGGPLDWPEGRRRPLGRVGGAELRITGFLRHARSEDHWIADSSRTGGPAIRWELWTGGGRRKQGGWLSDDDSTGAETHVDGTRVQLYQAVGDPMVEDFLGPPPEVSAARGTLIAYLGESRFPIRVDENVGKRVPLGETGLEVEIVEYLADAVPDPRGRFRPASDSAENPLLELNVYMPNRSRPLRQVAAARNGLLTMERVYAAVCPVKFRYHHPACSLADGVEFTRAPDGRFLARCAVGGRSVWTREIAVGDGVSLAGGGELRVVELLPHARRRIRYRSADVTPATRDKPESAVEIEVKSGDFAQRGWLSKNDPGREYRSVVTPRGVLRLRYADARVPLGFTLCLREFHRRLNPGGAGHAAFRSVVSVDGAARGGVREISMNRPLTCDDVTLYQSGFEATEFGHEVSVLRAAYDPGRGLKYVGGMLICLGIATMFYMRAYFFGRIPRLVPRGSRKRRSRDTASADSSMARLLAALLAVAGVSPATDARADDSVAAGPLDASAWSSLPVQEGGRRKPFDTLARETLRGTARRDSLPDPRDGRSLGASSCYLSMMLDWPGWELADRSRLLNCDSRRDYARLASPDRWDRAPVLYCEDVALRELLGLTRAGAHVAPATLHRVMVEDPRTGRRLAFADWVDALVTLDPGERSDVESQAIQLARRLWLYQEHRMGRGLELLPSAGNEDGKWITFAHLMLTDYDADVDPDGRLRRLQRLSNDVVRAYRVGRPGTWRDASATFARELREAGSRYPVYPAPWRTSVELSYNRWKPFRVAWLLMLVAAALLAWEWTTGRREIRRFSLGFYLAGLSAVVVGLTLRVVISGRAPVTNMYESVVFVGAAVALLGWLFERYHRRRYFLTAAAIVSTSALLLADSCPVVLDPSMRPLEPALRSNFWLVSHVITITLGYAAFALALGIANITLGCYLWGSTNRTAIGHLTACTYKAVQLGVLLLAAGILLGGIWADYAWGRFWGWDPKEVWALVALLGYVSVLHARFAGWVDQCELAALTAFCFCLIVMAWYGVNFLLGAGLHTYGFGGGGKVLVFSLLLLQMAYAGAAMSRRPRRDVSDQPARTSGRPEPAAWDPVEGKNFFRK